MFGSVDSSGQSAAHRLCEDALYAVHIVLIFQEQRSEAVTPLVIHLLYSFYLTFIWVLAVVVQGDYTYKFASLG